MLYFKVKNSKGLSCDGETYVQFEPYGKAWKSLKSLVSFPAKAISKQFLP